MEGTGRGDRRGEGCLPGPPLKVIIETCLLSDMEKIKLCQVVAKAEAAYLKTSTGFSTGAPPGRMWPCSGEPAGEREGQGLRRHPHPGGRGRLPGTGGGPAGRQRPGGEARKEQA